NPLKPPRPAFHQRPGKDQARGDILEGDAVMYREAGGEIGGGDAEVVVAHAALQLHHAARAFAELGGVAAVLHGDEPQGVRAETEIQKPGERVSDVETVELIVKVI